MCLCHTIWSLIIRWRLASPEPHLAANLWSAVPRPRVRLQTTIMRVDLRNPLCRTIAAITDPLPLSPRSTLARRHPIRGSLIVTSIEAIDTSMSSIPMPLRILLTDATAQTEHLDAWAHTRFTALRPSSGLLPRPPQSSRPVGAFDLLNQAATSNVTRRATHELASTPPY